MWEREAKHLCEHLRWPFTGGAPISIFCFQPIPEERFVYLQSKEQSHSEADRQSLSKRPPLYLHADKLSKELLCDEHPQLPWSSIVRCVDKEQIVDYLKNDLAIRKQFCSADKKRYANELFDGRTYFLKEGTEYRLQLLFPSPVFHHASAWWKRLPRLGICYTIDDRLGKPHACNEKHVIDPTDHMLAIMAVSAGNRILAKRLRSMFNNSYAWAEDEKTADEYFIELDVARRLCTEEIRPSDDKGIFFVAKLLLAHHLFFPHSPEALRVIQLLSENTCNDVLEMHGWPKMKEAIPPSPNLKESIENLTMDLALLTHALVRWTDPGGKADPDKKVDFTETLSNQICFVLALLCGKPIWITKGRSKHFAISPPALLQQYEPIEMPVYKDSQIATKTSGESSYYLKMLSPIESEAGLPSWNRTTLKMIKFPSHMGLLDKKHSSEWVSNYIFSRYLIFSAPKS